MPLKFDENGFLSPPERQELGLEEFKSYFVDSFPESATRKALFEGYLRYTTAFRSAVTADIIQWVGGSFTTKKRNPRDIDLVTIISHEVFSEKSDLIENRFRRGSKKAFGVDAYIVASYPEPHPKFPLYQGNLVYWDSHFSRSRKNRAGRRFQRGYVQIINQKIVL